MRRTAMGPYQIVKRQGRFEVHDGHAVQCRHDSYFDAEDWALRAWLGRKGHDDESDHQSFGATGQQGV
jgi:hypothetical protein